MTTRPRIFLIGKSPQDLIALEETEYVTEDRLQELLATFPDLLPGDQIDPEDPRRWLLVSREMGVPGREGGGAYWSLDHLFLDHDGIPTFVECKRSVDSRTRREVVAQMLDYAANGIAYWSVERIREAAEATAEARGVTLQEELAELTADTDEELDPEVFWERVGQNLEAHKVRLVFVADSAPRELRRLVEFLNEELRNVEVLIVEIRQYQEVGEHPERVLVPRVVGMTEKARDVKRAASGRKKWTEAMFFEALEDELRDPVRRLYDWCHEHADRVFFGHGAKEGSFTFHYRRDDQTASVFSVYTTGRLMLNYGYLSRCYASEVLGRFHERLAATEPFQHLEGDFGKFPTVLVEDLVQHRDAFSTFQETVLWLGQQSTSGQRAE